MARKKSAPKETAVEKLDNAIRDKPVPAPTGPLVTSRKIFGPYIEICREYLRHNQFSERARNLVAGMAFQFRQEALRRFKHDTVETFELAALVNTRTEVERRGRLDAVSHIMQNENPLHRFDVNQQEAAENIQKVWAAFSKGMGGSSGDLSRAGGSGRILQPLDTMGEELWAHYKRTYVPFYKQANRISVAHGGGGSVSMANIILRVLVEDIYPEQLDKNYGLKPGTCLRVIRLGLAHYHNPWELQRRLQKKPPSSPAQPRQDERSAPAGVETPPQPKPPVPEKKKRARKKVKSGRKKTSGPK